MPVQVMPDDHSKLVPPLPIPNRTVKQLCADDSAATSVKVGYRQACYLVQQPPAVPPREKPVKQLAGFFSSGYLPGPRNRRKKGSATRCLSVFTSLYCPATTGVAPLLATHSISASTAARPLPLPTKSLFIMATTTHS